MSLVESRHDSNSQHNFELLIESDIDGNITLTKYRSKTTGITVFIGDVKGPLVNGYLCFATEVHDDDGIPHTLEHLIFMGSEDYPYKGVLDLLANMCLASGTNAWTDIDHTGYTMTTAGSEGFLNLLPIYLDHILYPTLTDSAFTTEVHHINGEGEDAGIVYCEMQGRENVGESRCHLETMRDMYIGHCGYKSETGGILKNLRESTTNEKIRKFHKEFYRPENLCIIITGQVDHTAIFQALQPIEKKILEKGPRAAFVRPWQNPILPMEGPCYHIVPYPCDDDEHGMVYVAWRGPLINNYKEVLATMLLIEYLTETSVAPLQKEFVEIEDPYCSKVSGVMVEFSETCIMLEFESVPKPKLHLIKYKLQEVLGKIVNNPKALDMKRLATVIHRTKLEILSGMEDSAHDVIASRLIGDFLYGNSDKELQSRIQQIPQLDGFLEKSNEFWIGLLTKYFVDCFMAVTVGEASPEMLQLITESERSRIAATREALGPEGLKVKEEMLQKAIKENEKEPPMSLLSLVDIPSIKSIHYHCINRSCSYADTKDAVDGFPLSQFQLQFHIDDIKSVFVQLRALIDTSHLSPELRLYLPLWTQLILESPLLRNGKVIPYEDVVAELSEDMVFSGVFLGLEGAAQFKCGSHAQVVMLALKVEPEKYGKGVAWLRELLFSSQFVPERVSVVCKKMVNAVSQIKRSGSSLTAVLMRNICYRPKSNHWAASPLRQHAFLSKVLQTLDDKPQEVISSLEELRKQLTGVTFHVSMDVGALTTHCDPLAPWVENFQKTSGVLKLAKSEVNQCYELIQPPDCDLPSGVIAGVGAVESSFLIQTAPVDIAYTHPDVPAILVLIQYFTQAEGPMWSQIRGQGLAYSYGISMRLNERTMYFILYKSTHIVRAYKEAKSIVENHVSEATEWDEALLAASRSSLIFEIIEREKSIADVSLQSVLTYFRNLDMDYNRKLLDQVSKVEISDLQRVISLYLTPLFDPGCSRCAVCCHPSKVEEIVKGFQEMSRTLTIVKSLEDDLLTNFSEAKLE